MSDEITFRRSEKMLMYALLIIVIAFVGYILITGINTSHDDWARGLALADHAQDPNGMVLLSARGFDFLLVKASAVLLAFIMMALGIILVIHGAEATYILRVQGEGAKAGALETTSPGLVLVTLACVVIIVAIVSKTTIETTKTFEPQGDDVSTPADSDNSVAAKKPQKL